LNVKFRSLNVAALAILACGACGPIACDYTYEFNEIGWRPTKDSFSRTIEPVAGVTLVGYGLRGFIGSDKQYLSLTLINDSDKPVTLRRAELRASARAFPATLLYGGGESRSPTVQPKSKMEIGAEWSLAADAAKTMGSAPTVHLSFEIDNHQKEVTISYARQH
jgi:hypothetical protein